MKLLNINIGIKINNTKEISDFIKQQDADFVAIQEIVRHLEPEVFEEFKSKEGVENIVGGIYPFRFFGPLWITDAFRKEGKIHRDFGGLIEQGNEILSKYPIVEAANEHFYKTYAYAIDWTNWQTEDHGRAVVISTHDVNGKKLRILNLHGIWTKDKKGDERTIKECQYVLKRALDEDLPTIITGDFNLSPETASISVLDTKFRNLIKEFGITTTRPDFKDNIDEGMNVVDYVFVNNQIEVKDFGVIHTNVSDHLPLVLNFEVK